MTALLLPALAACAASAPDFQPDPSQPKGRRPFRAWVLKLEGLDADVQVEAVERVAGKLGADARVEPRPHWAELVQELHEREKTELLYELLRRRRIPTDHFEVLGNRFAMEHDERALRLLDNCLEFSRDSSYRRSAVWVLGNYCWNATHARLLSNRLVPIALEDPDPTTRAYALRALGIGGRRESIPTLRTALRDRAPVEETLNGAYGDFVGRWAGGALEMIEKQIGQPLPPEE